MSDAWQSPAVSKAVRRLIWLLALLYLAEIFAQANAGIAVYPLMHERHATGAGLTLGFQLFLLGSVICQVPSCLALERFGARAWLAGIAIAWGIVAMLMAFAHGSASFAALNFLLGAAQAGFVPGALYSLTPWFPAARRARTNALFFLAIPLGSALMLNYPIELMALDGTGRLAPGLAAAGFAGWQSLCILGGLPAVVLGVVAIIAFADRPATASWLSPDDKAAVAASLAAEPRSQAAPDGFVAILRDPVTWALGAAYFCLGVPLFAASGWIPRVITALTMFSFIPPWLLAAVILVPSALMMFLWSRDSDRSGKRVWNLVVAALVCAAGWLLALFAGNILVLIAAAIAAVGGTYALISMFWVCPAALFRGRGAAAGFALINTMGTLGAYFGGWVIGPNRWLSTGNPNGLLVTVGLAVVAGAIILAVGGRLFARGTVAA